VGDAARPASAALALLCGQPHGAAEHGAKFLAIQRQQQELKQFLRLNLYQHHQVARMTNKARRIVADLFSAFVAEPRLLPPQYHEQASADPARTVADYIAGMTDRYAMREHRRLFAVDEI